ncbi:MAG: hypothetical protein M0Z54_07320 [Thermaerobacter sp.]|nr:hypothetical protein [Thermaerobacter sp.]
MWLFDEWALLRMQDGVVIPPNVRRGVVAIEWGPRRPQTFATDRRLRWPFGPDASIRWLRLTNAPGGIDWSWEDGAGTVEAAGQFARPPPSAVPTLLTPILFGHPDTVGVSLYASP